jgi:hypothetical protein
MDEGELGERAASRFIEASLKQAQAQAIASKLPFKGTCYNCDAELANRNFCDTECRDEYEEIERKRKIGRL